MASDATGISVLFSIPITAGQKMVGVRGFELLTSCSQSRRATGLRYTPVKKSTFKRRLLRSVLLASDLKI